MRSSINPIKISIEILSSRLEQIEDKISGLEDKVDVLEHADNDKEKKLKKHEQNMQDFWATIKRPNLQIMDIEKEEVKIKGIESIFNKIIV
jgi:chromosome segregation ATPase